MSRRQKCSGRKLASAGVAYFSFGGNEYSLRRTTPELAVSSDDAIVKLVGVHDLNHPSNVSGLVTLHA